jgi:hypothetical protein
MDDLKLIGDFRSDLAEPDADTTVRARAAVMEAIAQLESESRRARRRRRWPSRRRSMAFVAVGGVALAVLLSTLLAGDEPGAPPGAAAAVLRKASLTAGRQPQSAPGPGQYVYTKSRSLDESDWYDVGSTGKQSFAVRMLDARQAWIATNGSGRIVERTGPARFLSRHDRQVWIATGRPALGGGRTTSQRFGPGGLSFVDLTRLPTDPTQLAKLIDERKVEGGPPGPAETFTIIGDLLRETYAPPKLRAALFQIASQLPIVHLFGPATWTPRRGIAVGYTYAGTRHELVFDPKTAALLGERTVTVRTGAVTSWSVYLASRIVDSTSSTAAATPDGHGRPTSRPARATVQSAPGVG